MFDRRTLATVAVAAALVTAGCGFITGDEALAFDASPTTVSDEAQSSTDYEEVNVSERVITREFSAAGQTREVQVTNHLARYERRVDLGPLGSQRAGVFTIFSSPEVSVAGRTFNPIADRSEREILRQFESEYENIEVDGRVSNRSRTVLGQETSVRKFAGSATLGGQDVDIYVHVTKVKHEGDFVVALAVYPQRIDDDEQPRVNQLLDGFQHSGE